MRANLWPRGPWSPLSRERIPRPSRFPLRRSARSLRRSPRQTEAKSSLGKRCGSNCAAPREHPAANRDHGRRWDADRGCSGVVGPRTGRPPPERSSKILTGSSICFVCSPPWAPGHVEPRCPGCGESRFPEFGSTCTTEWSTMPFKFSLSGIPVAVSGRTFERGTAEHAAEHRVAVGRQARRPAVARQRA